MEITKIEKQKKDKNRYSIFLDREFAFSLYEDTILKYGLRSGDNLDDQKIIDMKEFDEFSFGKKVAYSFLAYRQRSKKEIVKKLSQKKISSSTIEKITEMLEKQKYVDDKSYAKNYLEDKLTHKPVGKRLARLKLLEKGIEKEVAENIIEENFTEDKEVELAKGLLKKYVKKVKNKDEREKRSKCFRYLISRGFDFETVRRALSIED